jgi:putative transposase
MLDRPSPIREPLDDDPGRRPGHPNLDDLMADDLHPHDVVFIDDKAHEFLRKEPHGPHVFWNGVDKEEARYTTIQFLKLQAAGRYCHPQRNGPKFDDKKDGEKLAKEHRERLRFAFAAFAERPRSLAAAKWLYVQEFLARIRNAEAEGGKYHRNHENAASVIAFTDDWIERKNAEEKNRAKWIVKPRNRCPRSLLRWVARELKMQLQEAGLIHFNAVKPRRRRLPGTVFVIIASTIREMVKISAKLGPTKILIRVKEGIDAHNAKHGTALPYPKITTVKSEYRRYDAWVRLAAEKGVEAADLEYGTVGKLERPRRILDLVEVDHHKFDFHAVFGETPFVHAMSRAGLDRFWVCLALDVHSGYPLGFTISFEPGGLLPALACIDHAIRPKTYVRERWPHIDGDLLGFGKPVRFRYDNGKEFVSLLLQAALARVGIGFQMAIPKHPESKPYVERFFGTLEQDFVHWLKGSTGSNVKDKAHRKPIEEACVSLDDFVELFHQYLIECYARRKQQDLDWDTPEERWVRGANSPSHRPRPLTSYELARWDIVASIEVDVNATDEGFLWRDLDFQSEDLQTIRRRAGYHGLRKKQPTPLKARIPLRDVSTAFVANPLAREDETGGTPAEIAVPCVNPHVKKRTLWQHEVVCGWLRSKKKNPTNYADYEEGFRHLFGNALRKMGVKLDGKEPKHGNKRKAGLTLGQAPRFAGVLLGGPDKHALHNTDKLTTRYDMFGELEAAAKAKAAADKAATPKRKGRSRKKFEFKAEGDPLADRPEEQRSDGGGEA